MKTDARYELRRSHRGVARFTTRARMLAVLVPLAATTAVCKEPGPPSVASPPARPHAGTVCDVLAAEAGTDAARFGAHFPVAVGGAVLVLSGDAAKITSLADSFGLIDVRAVSCPAGAVVAFFPGVDARSAADIERELMKANAASAIRERHVFAPAEPPARQRRARSSR